MAVREREQRRWSPLVVAIVLAALGLLGNAVVAFINGWNQQRTEQAKDESQLILETIKTDIKQARENLRFLVDSGLIVGEPRRTQLLAYLDKTPAGTGPSLPANWQLGRYLTPSSHTVDYVCHFVSPDAAKSALPQLWAGSDWRRDFVTETKWYEEKDATPGTAPLIDSEFYLLVAKTGVDESIWAVPECVLELDRDQGVVRRTRLNEEQLRRGHFEPVFAGSHYPIPLYTNPAR